ncbi:MAG: glycosyltransferase family 1 protein [Thermoprotei archaeon]|nr:MAG: glycosyltransferase family 1 protein [Thermoprotei archaeon]
MTEHGWPNIWVENFTRKPYYIKEAKCLKKLNSVGVPIITISEFARKMLTEYLDVRVSKVIYHGLLDEFRTTSPRFPKKTHVILWVGRLVPAKEPEVFIKALGLIKSKVRFKAVIRGDGPLKRKILKLIKKMRLASRVYFVRKLSFSSLPKLYGSATLYIHTASMEPFGFSLLEAMGSGLPVIVPRAGGAYEIAGSLSLTFYPGDSFDLADKIEGLINDEEEYYKQSKRSIGRAKYFRWEKTVKEYVEVYKKFL